MKPTHSLRSASRLLFVTASAFVACGGPTQVATQAQIDECHAACLSFGPETCTRQCYATCEAEGGSCAASVSGQLAMVNGMQCFDKTVNFFTDSSTRSCSPGQAPAPFAGSLPTGAWNSSKRMFITSQTYVGGQIKQAGGMATGLLSGDKICQDIAASASLGGTFKVWLSDSTTNAVNRIADAGPWYSTDRSQIFFRNKAGLVAAPLGWLRPEDERGKKVDGTGFIGLPDVWTGTGKTGLQKQPSLGNMTNCADWTATTYMPFGSPQPLYGWSGSLTVAAEWTEDTDTNNCATSGHLYCFEQ